MLIIAKSYPALTGYHQGLVAEHTYVVEGGHRARVGDQVFYRRREEKIGFVVATGMRDGDHTVTIQGTTNWLPWMRMGEALRLSRP